jgi:hypothetical protein
MNISQLKTVLSLLESLEVKQQQPTQPTQPTGRYVVVVDRGWVFAGDLSMTEDGCVRLDNAVHVFKWNEIGFSRVLTEWMSEKVDLRKLSTPVEIPSASVVFRLPVEAGWGLK